jgi:hypothetical protein
MSGERITGLLAAGVPPGDVYRFVDRRPRRPCSCQACADAAARLGIEGQWAALVAAGQPDSDCPTCSPEPLYVHVPLPVVELSWPDMGKRIKGKPITDLVRLRKVAKQLFGPDSPEVAAVGDAILDDWKATERRRRQL